MKLRYRILSILGIVLALAFASFAIAVSYNSPCGGSAAAPAGGESMQGVVIHCYGSPDVMKVVFSSRMNCANSSGVLPTGSSPCAAR